MLDLAVNIRYIGLPTKDDTSEMTVRNSNLYSWFPAPVICKRVSFLVKLLSERLKNYIQFNLGIVIFNSTLGSSSIQPWDRLQFNLGIVFNLTLGSPYSIQPWDRLQFNLGIVFNLTLESSYLIQPWDRHI